MLDLETRKKHTKSVIKFFKDGMYEINPNNNVNGIIILILHWVCASVPLLGLFLFKLNWKFYLSSLVWVIICALHLVHNGCIFTRIERELWESKEWYGPWVLPFTILEKLGIEVTGRLANNIFIFWGIILVIWIIFRIVFSV